MQNITLSNCWGWHFNRVLDDLCYSLKDDLGSVATELGCKHPDKLELFRRSWPIELAEDSRSHSDVNQASGGERTTENLSERLVYRWSFFDNKQPTKEQRARLRKWQRKIKKRAHSFLNQLSSLKQYLSVGTVEHINHLRDDFFSCNLNNTEDLYAFLEDWRALYLQTPTEGTMLQDLWEQAQEFSCNHHNKPIGFIVRTFRSHKNFPDFEFLTFCKGNHSPIFSQKRTQNRIHLFHTNDGVRHSHSASDFFQRELFPGFYDARLEPQNSTPGLLRDVKYLLFIPIFIDRMEKSHQWLGVLQIRFKRMRRGRSDKSESLELQHLTNNSLLQKRIDHLAKIVQMLANDLIFAHVQESFDRPFPKQSTVETLDSKWCEQIIRIRRRDVACKATWHQFEQLSLAEYKRVFIRIEKGREQAREFISHEKVEDKLLALRDGKFLRLTKALESKNIPLAVSLALDAHDEIKSVSKRLGDLGKGGNQWVPDAVIDVEKKIAEALDDLRLLIDTTPATCSVTVMPKGLKIKLDESKFEAVLRIPIKNSLTSILKQNNGRTGGRLNISAYTYKKSLHVEIGDNGRRMTRKQIISLKKNPPGIGLFLLDEYVNAAKGKIHWSPNRGGGQKITIKIPIQQ